MKLTANGDSERFQTDVAKYATYLRTPEGQLRLDLTFANLQEHLPPAQAKGPLCALDLGCGPGTTAVRLARLGVHVTLLDSSSAMLDLAERAVQEAGVADRTLLKAGDAACLSDLFPDGSFDLILCHNLLEYVDDPNAVLRSATRVMRDPLGIISILVRNQAGEVLKAAIQAGDLAAAERNLNAEWGQESLYGGRVRLFTPDSVDGMLKTASLTTISKRGVRVISDYLPPQISRNSEYERILALERKLGSRAEFAVIARYTHCLARRAVLAMRDLA